MASYTYDFLELGDEHALGCKCCRFSHGADLPVPKKLSITEVTRHATSFSHSIFSDWTKLNAILKRFEGTIQKRWMKKSPKQKREILLKAWPEMPTTHRPDFSGFRNVRKTAPRSRTCPSAAFLWPYINLEDLQQRHLLLLFLNSRGRNLPGMFVNADVEAAHVGHGWDFSDDQQTGTVEMSMQFQGLHSPRTYGRLIANTTALHTHTVQPYHPTFGLLVLEIQQGIYSFLLTCTKMILHDIEPTHYLLAPHQPLPTLPEPTSNQWPSLSSHMLETPYRVPQKMDLQRLKTLVGARRASAEDHLWMLREDPGYFLESLKDWKEHDQEMVKHNCRRHWQLLAAKMIADAFTYFIYWDFIYRKMDTLPSIEDQLKRADCKKMRLPKKEETTWATLLEVIDELVYTPITNLSAGFPPSPRMRHCYNWDTPPGKEKDVWAAKHKLTESERRADLLFFAITSDEQRHLHSTNHLVQEIQYMLDTEPEASQLIDSWLVGHFSDLAMLSELKLRIQGLQPWSGIWLASGVQKSKAVTSAAGKIFELDKKLSAAIIAVCSDTRLLGDPLDGAFDYPANKRETEANIEQMRYAEATLDSFWIEIEIRVGRTYGLQISETVSSRLMEERQLYRTPEWMPPLVAQKKLPPALAEVSNNVPRFRDTCADGVATTPIIKLKTKIKTKGVASPSPSPTVARAPSPEPGEADGATQKIKVPKRAFRALSALIPDSNVENHQRIEVAWDELLQAMNAIGLQPEKLYGSVWMFKPKAAEECLVDMKRSIQFHEPKEVRRGGKIPTNMVRTFGRRLRYAYGWEGGMFVSE